MRTWRFKIRSSFATWASYIAGMLFGGCESSSEIAPNSLVSLGEGCAVGWLLLTTIILCWVCHVSVFRHKLIIFSRRLVSNLLAFDNGCLSLWSVWRQMRWEKLTRFLPQPQKSVASASFVAFCREGIRIFGTGGRLLLTLLTLMDHLQKLQEVKLENLLLDRFEAVHLLDSVLSNCEESLRRLSVINCTNHNYFFMHCGLFLNLQCLTLSTNHIQPDLIKLISGLETLEEFHIVQTEFTSGAQHVRSRDWEPLRENSGRIKLFLEVRGKQRHSVDHRAFPPKSSRNQTCRSQRANTLLPSKYS